MPHFRTMLTSEHFCAADLYSEREEKFLEINVQIVAVTRGEVVGEKGRKKGMPFITMRSEKTGKEIPKKLGLNATNCETVASLVGSPEVKRWLERWITLYVTKTDVGTTTRDAIRIRPTAPKIGNQPPPATGPAPTRNAIEASLKENGLIDQTTKERNDQIIAEAGAQYAFDPDAPDGES